MTEKRISALREKFAENSLDAFLITSYENYRYFSGFSGSNCALIISEKECFALTDGRYDLQIRNQVKGYSITVISRPMYEHIAELLSPFSRIGYESEKITDAEIRKIEASIKSGELIPCRDYGEEIRSIKDSSEIDSIRRAVMCSDKAFEAFVTKISRGMTELSAAALLEYEMAKLGSRKPAFSTIAASGLNSALPHAEPQDKEIPSDCLMTFDFGATVSGYMSDITRTILIGNPAQELCDLWDLVFEVQQKCIAYIKSGMKASELDEYQRSLFAEKGMDKYIMHSLGHGVGLAIHEAPTVSRRSSAILSENMIITIEPGLYIENLGGVRTEDMVLITRNGAEVLTKAPHRFNINI